MCVLRFVLGWWGSGQSRTACDANGSSPSGSLLCIHASWGVLWVHRVWSFSVGRIVCTIGRSVSFFLSLLHGCVFQRLHARPTCMVLAGQPAPVTPLSFTNRVQWVCLRQVSVFPPSLQEPRHGHFRGRPRRPPAVRTRMHACMHARARMPSPSLSSLFHPALPTSPLPSLSPRPRGAGLHGQSPVLFLRL